MRLYSWNVNGLRAMLGKGFFEWLETAQPDVVCLQETKLQPDQLPEALSALEGYTTWLAAGERKGYSGVGLLSCLQPQSVKRDLGEYKFDREGRVIEADYGDFVLLGTYFPNGGMSRERLAYKLEFYDFYLDHLLDLKSAGRAVVVCGDVNTAHMERDLARPKENVKTSGFLPEERAWLDKLVGAGFVDTFRMFEEGGGQYSWWDMKTRARERNVGWRLDYFFVSENLTPKVKRAWIEEEVMGSDHCPVGLELEL